MLICKAMVKKWQTSGPAKRIYLKTSTDTCNTHTYNKKQGELEMGMLASKLLEFDIPSRAGGWHLQWHPPLEQTRIWLFARRPLPEICWHPLASPDIKHRVKIAPEHNRARSTCNRSVHHPKLNANGSENHLKHFCNTYFHFHETQTINNIYFIQFQQGCITTHILAGRSA